MADPRDPSSPADESLPVSTVVESQPVETQVETHETTRRDVPDHPRTSQSADADRLGARARPDDAADDRLSIGQKLSGRYRIERELGEGGMGIVYLATDEHVAGETFAIKVLKESFSHSAFQQLRDEVRKTRKLGHPNIVDVHSVNIDGTRLYVLMEYLEGKSLGALLDEEFGRGMPLSRAAPIIDDACAALGYAHDHNVIHSDLKPANIFVTTSGKTKLLDFGIARLSRGPLMLKSSGTVLLTPAYASGEMMKGQVADSRDDIYALACVVYEMLSGERPFGRLNALDARKAGARVRGIRSLSRKQNKALAQALAFDREKRTASVEAFFDELGGRKAAGVRPRTSTVAWVVAMVVLGAAVLAYDRFWISRQVVVSQPAPVEPAAIPSPKSIAVLPFLDLSAGGDSHLFADGLTTALIDRLTLFPGLSVVGQTSSFAVKDSKEDAPSLARRLHVEYLLEGTVRGSGEHLRVSTRLIRASDGFELWSQIFERQGNGVLSLEEDIARAVVTDLRGGLLDWVTPVRPTTSSLEAYRLLLQADHLWRQEAATDDERVLIEAALQKDVAYVDAWVDLGSWWYDAMLLGKVGSDKGVPEARHAYERARALDKDSAGAYRGLAWLQMSQLDWRGARESLAVAGRLDPASLVLLTVRGQMARSAGKWDEAIRLQRERLRRDPLSVGSRSVLAENYLCAGDYAKAVSMLTPAIDENAKYPGSHAVLGRALAAEGNFDAALKLINLEPDEPLRLAGLATVQFDSGHRDASDEALLKLRMRYGQTLPGLAGLVYAHRRQLDEAFQWLGRAVAERQPEIAASLACTPEPVFAPFRNDLRYAGLRSSLGLDP